MHTFVPRPSTFVPKREEERLEPSTYGQKSYLREIICSRAGSGTGRVDCRRVEMDRPELGSKPVPGAGTRPSGSAAFGGLEIFYFSYTNLSIKKK